MYGWETEVQKYLKTKQTWMFPISPSVVKLKFNEHSVESLVHSILTLNTANCVNHTTTVTSLMP